MTVAGINREAVLASHLLMRHLRPGELHQLAASATVVRHPRHTRAFQKGDAGDTMMMVIRGRVKICTQSDEGKELVLNIIRHGGLFGEIALLDEGPRTADAVMLEETDLLVLERTRLLPVLASNPEVMLRLTTVLCQRLRQTNAHLEDTVLREAPSRLARGLLHHPEACDEPVVGAAMPEAACIRTDRVRRQADIHAPVLSQQGAYRFGRFVLDLDRMCLLDEHRGAELKLRPKSFDLLRHIVAKADRLVSRDELMQAVWPDVYVTDDSITQCVKDIRCALADDAQRLLRTVPKRGYIFAAEVSCARPAAAGGAPTHYDHQQRTRPAVASAAAPTRKPSVSVQPFTNLSQEPDTEYSPVD
jgi:CRP-like cAMP-binding protein/DNA-binding winged helix-turn-helix (wHTH) protein